MTALDLSGGPIMAPTVFDAGSAVIAGQFAFGAVYLSSFAAEASLLGTPDMGIITVAELADLARRVAQVTQQPLIVDADTGFGGSNNVHRTIRLLEDAGAAAVQIEDQINPKKCPVIPGGRAIVSRREAVGRIEVAAAARRSPDFRIIARTDADTISPEEQVDRCNAFLAAGADIALPLAIEWRGRPFAQLPPAEQMDAYSYFVKQIDGPVASVTMPSGLSAQHLFDIGIRVVIVPDVYHSVASTLHRIYSSILADQTDEQYYRQNGRIPATSLDLLRLFGLDEMAERYTRFDTAAATSTAALD